MKSTWWVQADKETTFLKQDARQQFKSFLEFDFAHTRTSTMLLRLFMKTSETAKRRHASNTSRELKSVPMKL